MLFCQEHQTSCVKISEYLSLLRILETKVSPGHEDVGLNGSWCCPFVTAISSLRTYPGTIMWNPGWLSASVHTSVTHNGLSSAWSTKLTE